MNTESIGTKLVFDETHHPEEKNKENWSPLRIATRLQYASQLAKSVLASVKNINSCKNCNNVFFCNNKGTNDYVSLLQKNNI